MISPTRLRGLLSSAGTLKRKLLRQADRDRWADPKSFSPEWNERSRLIASLISKGSRVIEFGAGLSHLPSFLDSSCTYVASDFVGRSPDTLLVDLERRPLPTLPSNVFDVAVFAGVLEYLSDVPRVASWIRDYAPTCICSYECALETSLGYKHLRQSWDRAALGWENSFTEEEIKAVFVRAGFVCAEKVLWKTPDGSEPIFVFRVGHPKNT